MTGNFLKLFILVFRKIKGAGGGDPVLVTVYPGKNHGPWRALGCAGSGQYS